MPTKKKPPDPVVRDISIRQLLDEIRSCSSATVESMKKEGTKKSLAFERRCYRDLFKFVAGRKPTEPELDHMVGGKELTPRKA